MNVSETLSTTVGQNQRTLFVGDDVSEYGTDVVDENSSLKFISSMNSPNFDNSVTVDDDDGFASLLPEQQPFILDGDAIDLVNIYEHLKVICSEDMMNIKIVEIGNICLRGEHFQNLMNNQKLHESIVLAMLEMTESHQRDKVKMFDTAMIRALLEYSKNMRRDPLRNMIADEIMSKRLIGFPICEDVHFASVVVLPESSIIGVLTSGGGDYHAEVDVVVNWLRSKVVDVTWVIQYELLSDIPQQTKTDNVKLFQKLYGVFIVCREHCFRFMIREKLWVFIWRFHSKQNTFNI